MGELDMYRQAGTKPNFSEVARRYGLNHRTVAKYWKSGGQIEDARTERPSAFDAVRDVIEEKAALPGGWPRPPRAGKGRAWWRVCAPCPECPRKWPDAP